MTMRPEDHAIHVLLEEQFGAVEPPDVSARVLAEIELRSRCTVVGRWMSRRRLEARGWVGEVWAWVAVSLLLALALVGCALVVGSTGAAPFIYTMF